jgi:hypothetical protein
METVLPVTLRAESLAQLGFPAVLPGRVLTAAQVDVNKEVAGRVEWFNTAIGRKISLSTANMASR